jgi:hypothetical protein
MKLSTRWTRDPESYSYHMLNKMKIVRAFCGLFSDSGIVWKELAGLVVKKEWCVPEKGDFVNYQFIYDLCKDYIEYSKKLEIPLAESIVYENVVKYIASLVKQDPAYHTRFNGILFRILHDFTHNSISSTPGENIDYLKKIVKWWDIFDGRERNHDLYKKFLDHVIEKYKTEEFYQKSIDWVLNEIGKRIETFVYSDEMNPKNWYGNNGVGFADNMTRGGRG